MCARLSKKLRPNATDTVSRRPSKTLPSGYGICRWSSRPCANLSRLSCWKAADLTLDPQAVQLRVEDEVHDTGDRIGAVDGRRAASQHFDTLDEGRRDAVDVRNGKARIARHEAMAIYEHKRPDGAEAAKVDRSGTCRAGGHELALRRIDLRKPVEDLLDVGRAFELEFVALDHRDGTDGGQIGTRDARTGDHDLWSRGARSRFGLRGSNVAGTV